jgi:hypothetical protein
MFDKMLKELCPYHRGPVKHTLEECDMLRRYFNKAGPSVEGGKDQGNNKKEGDKEEEFPEVHNCFMIYDGQVANASARHRKQERREVCSVKVATPVYLDQEDTLLSSTPSSTTLGSPRSSWTDAAASTSSTPRP